MDLVAAHGEHVDAHPFRINPVFAERLDRIDMKIRFRIFRLDSASDLLDWLNSTDLIVDIHNRNENRLRRDRFFEFVHIHKAFFIYRQARNTESLLLQKCQRC